MSRGRKRTKFLIIWNRSSGGAGEYVLWEMWFKLKFFRKIMKSQIVFVKKIEVVFHLKASKKNRYEFSGKVYNFKRFSHWKFSRFFLTKASTFWWKTFQRKLSWFSSSTFLTFPKIQQTFWKLSMIYSHNSIWELFSQNIMWHMFVAIDNC